MAENQYYIGVDIGTTSTKAVLYGDRAEVLSSHHLTYPLHSPHPTIAEQDPDEIFHAVFHTIHQVIKMGNIDPKKVAFVSFSAAMHSLIAVDGHGRPLTRSITWADTRAKAWAENQNRMERNGNISANRYANPSNVTTGKTDLVKKCASRDFYKSKQIYRNQGICLFPFVWRICV